MPILGVHLFARRNILMTSIATATFTLALIGCSSNKSASSSTTTTANSGGDDVNITLTMPVTSSRSFATELVTLGSVNADVEQDAFGVPDVWVAHGLPKTALDGSGIAATPTTISGFTSVSSKSGQYDEAYPFAVSDGTTCTFGVIYTSTSSAPPVGKVYDAKGACTGSAALDEFEATIGGK
jgi:hypothetical protein